MKFIKYFILYFLSVVALGQVPTSERSIEAITRVKPILEPALKGKGLRYGAPIFIRIFKKSKELEVWIQKGKQYKLFKTYSVCTYGAEGLGPKIKEGDGQAPEGFYSISTEQMNPLSSYHLAFNLGYPNEYDLAYYRTGSALMVHGECDSIGCYAMTNPSIEEIYALASGALDNGQSSFQVHIFPFRMTKKNMLNHKTSGWYDFWKNLKEGYDIFEKSHIPPNVRVKDKKYVFNTRD